MKHFITKAMTFAALGTVLAVASASAQQPAPPTLPPAGGYKLTQIDNANLPVLLMEKDNCKQEITKAELEVSKDSKYTLETTIKETCGDKTQEKKSKEQGTIAASTGKIQFTPETKVVPSAAAAEMAAVSPPESMLTESSAIIDNGALKVTLKSNKVLTFTKG